MNKKCTFPPPATASSVCVCVCVCASSLCVHPSGICIPLAWASSSHVHPSAVCVSLTSASHLRLHRSGIFPPPPGNVCSPLPACPPPSMCAPPPRSASPSPALSARSVLPPRSPGSSERPPTPPPTCTSPVCPPRFPGTPVPLPWRGHPRGVAVAPRSPPDGGGGGGPPLGLQQGWRGAREGKGPGSSGAPPARPTPPPAPHGPPLTEAGEGLAAAERRESHFLPTRFSSGDGCRGNKKKDKSLDPRHGQGSSCSGSRAAAARTCGDVLRLGRPIAHGRLLRRSLLGKDRCQQLKNTPARGESRQQ